MSDTELPQYVPSKDELKARLTLEFVCDQLGISLNRSGQAMCPFHDGETDPSFYLWDGDDGRRRWHCQPCGEGGDIFDLIRKARGCSFSDSLSVAADMLSKQPDDYVAPDLDLAPAIAEGPETWDSEVAAGMKLAASTERLGQLPLKVGYTTVNDPDGSLRWHQHLLGWGWGIDWIGSVMMPHWNENGALTGCKIRRTDGERVSLKGSKYEALYGSWRPKVHASVILCAGETDTAYADYAAREEGLLIDVLGVPRGESAEPTARQAARLKDYKTVFLALDPDAAGIKGTHAWVEILSRMNKDVRVCLLPLGRDLRSARPVLKLLLQAARRPILDPAGIFEEPGGYERENQDGDRYSLTNWTVEPLAQLVGSDDRGYDAILHHGGTKQRVVIWLSDLSSSQSLNKWANPYGLMFTSTSRGAREKIAELIQARGSLTPEIYQTDRLGLHKTMDPKYGRSGWSVVYPSESLGLLPWRYAPTSKTQDLTDRVRLHRPAQTDGWDYRYLLNFLALGPPELMEPLLAWIVASARRPEFNQFPLLFISGSSGTGKSTIAREACRLAGTAQLQGEGLEYKLESITGFIMLKAVSSTTSLPIFLDEWTRTVKPETRAAFQSNIPSLYDGGRAERGQADLTSQVYRMTSPVILAGEDTFTMTREHERIITLHASKPDAERAAALAACLHRPLHLFGPRLHTFIVSRPDLLPTIQQPEVTTRPAYNREVLMQGWQTLHALLEYAAHANDAVPDLSVTPNLDYYDISADAEDDPYELAVQVAAAYRDQNHVPYVWSDPEGRGTWIRPLDVTNVIRQRATDLQLPGGYRAMLDYFRERYGDLTLDPGVEPPGSTGQRVRAHLIPNHILQGGYEEDPRTGWTA